MSDGGIASNFPIHFFDVWLPSRPTFGINLVTRPEESFEVDVAENLVPDRVSRKGRKPATTRRVIRSERQAVIREKARIAGRDVSASLDAELMAQRRTATQAVYLPRADEVQFPDWMEIKGITGFMMNVWATAQNYRDLMQSQLPSYRERIVQVRFSPLEGGLNLAMKDTQLKALVEKGREAGALLREQFCFGEHQWVRFLVLMEQLEAQLTKTRNPFPDAEAYKNMLLKSQTDRYAFKHDEAWYAEAERRVDAVLELLTRWDGHRVGVEMPPTGDLFFAQNVPRPTSVLRVMPTV
jgi:hypothetical protein